MDIFVGSLPFKLSENGLKEIFEKFGKVSSVKLIIDKARHMKKGFGFVVMPDEEQALAAITALDGTEILGRTIVVKKSEEKTEERRKNKDSKPGDGRGKPQVGKKYIPGKSRKSF